MLKHTVEQVADQPPLYQDRDLIDSPFITKIGVYRDIISRVFRLN